MIWSNVVDSRDSQHQDSVLMRRIFPEDGVRKWEFVEPKTGQSLVAAAWAYADEKGYYSLTISFGISPTNEHQLLTLRITRDGEVTDFCTCIERNTAEGWVSNLDDDMEAIIPDGTVEEQSVALERAKILLEAMSKGQAKDVARNPIPDSLGR